MVDAALKIVSKFAPTKGENEDFPDTCHVGSALFLGPNIRFMCSEQKDTIEQVAYRQFTMSSSLEIEEGHPPDGFRPDVVEYKESTPPWKNNDGTEKVGSNTWIRLAPVLLNDTIRMNFSGTGYAVSPLTEKETWLAF